MLNFVWAFMIILGVVISIINGRLGLVTEAIVTSSKEAITVCISMLGILSFWSGLMKIAEKGGLVKILSDKMSPFLKFLFPDLKKGGKAMEYISINIIANLLGLGWAATPAGLKAMEELQKLNKDKETASRTMCAFLIFNMSSLQLLSINLIAYRAQYDAKIPSDVILPGLLATLISSLAAIIIIKAFELFGKKSN